jgi:hypothetical protein
MENIKIQINVDAIAESLNLIKEEIQQAVDAGVQKLASATHAHVIELAQERLHTTRDKYLEALSFEEIVPGVYVVSLDLDKAGWIEEGKPSGSMLDDLLRYDAKTSKDGNRYKVIPFEHSKAPSQMNDKAKKYVSTIKAELKKRGLPYKKLEYGPDGSPRIGKLHQFNIKSTYPSARAKTPALYGLTIYQHKDERTGKVRRDIMTFRIASDKHRAEGLWFHPGIEPRKFLDKAAEWAVKTFENEILPTILEQFK